MSQTGILVIGINHKAAPVEEREKLDEEKLLKQLSLSSHLFTEWVILSTCNRMEIYTITPTLTAAEKKLQAIFPIQGYYVYKNRQAIQHIYAVAGGLDSMVLGESEILSQIKAAYKKACDSKSIGTTLHQLFKEAIRVSKHIRHKTRISKGITSLAQSTLLLAKKQMKTLSNRKILLIGAGDMARTILKSLQEMGITDVTVVNRTYQHAVLLTSTFGGKAAVFSKLPSLLAESDVVMSATASPNAILSYAMVKKAMKKRENRPLCLVDLAVPRDIDAKVSTLPDVYLFDIDDMQQVVNSGVSVRRKAAHEAQAIIKNAVEEFLLWDKTQQAVPVLTALTQKSAAIRDQELTKALNKLMHVSDHDKKVVSNLAKRLESKLVARLIANLRHAAQEKNGQKYLSMITTLFEL